MSDTKYSYSVDEEMYHGTYASTADACKAAMADPDCGSRFWVGEQVLPTQPEEWWDASDWLELVSDQDEYCGEHAEDWDRSTREQRKELEHEVRALMAAWLDRYDLRPKFWNIENVTTYTVTDIGGYPSCEKAGAK